MAVVQWYEGIEPLHAWVCVHRRAYADRAVLRQPWHVLLHWNWRGRGHRLTCTWIRIWSLVIVHAQWPFPHEFGRSPTE